MPYNVLITITDNTSQIIKAYVRPAEIFSFSRCLTYFRIHKSSNESACAGATDTKLIPCFILKVSDVFLKFRKILDNDRRRNSQLVNLAGDFGLSFMRIACHYPAHKTGEMFTDNCVLIESGVRDEAFLKLVCETSARVFNRESYLFKASNSKVSLCFPDAPDSDLGVFTSENFTEFMSAFIASRNSFLKNVQCSLLEGMSFDLIADNTPKPHRGQYSWQVINGRTDYLREYHCFPLAIKKWLSDWSKLDADPEIA